MQKELASLREEREMLADDYQQLNKTKIKLNFITKDLSEELKNDNMLKEKTEKELSRIEDLIREKEVELEKIKPQCEVMKAREGDCSKGLTLKEQKRKVLYAKGGRGSQFSSKEDRDKWIQNELL